MTEQQEAWAKEFIRLLSELEKECDRCKGYHSLSEEEKEAFKSECWYTIDTGEKYCPKCGRKIED